LLINIYRCLPQSRGNASGLKQINAFCVAPSSADGAYGTIGNTQVVVHAKGLRFKKEGVSGYGRRKPTLQRLNEWWSKKLHTLEKNFLQPVESESGNYIFPALAT